MVTPVPHDREHLPAAGAADDLPGGRRGQQQARHHRQHVHAGHGRADALHHLEEGRQVGHRAEQGEAHDETDHGGEREGADAEEFQRQHGFGGAPLDGHEDDGEDDAQDGEPDELRGPPPPGRTAEGGDQHQAGGDGRDEEGAEVVDDVPSRPARDVQDGRDHGERDDADGQIDVEHPTPAQMLREQPAEQRPEHTGRAEHGPEQPLVPTAFARRHEIPDDRHRQHQQPAPAESLQGPEGDELGHVLRRAAQRGADEEDHDRRLEQPLAAVLVAELAPQGGRGGRGQQVGGDDPGQVIHATEVADDGGQRGRHDGLVQRGEQHAEEQGTDGDQYVPGYLLRGEGFRG